MKLIGITGKSGAGKTTFSEYLATNNRKDIGVIHVDDLIKELKLKYFKIFMKKDNKGEKVRVDSRLKKFLHRNKYIFSAFMKFRSKLVEPLLNKKIEELSKTKKIIIIDDIFIKYHKVYSELDKIYLIERPFRERKEALVIRDGISKEEIAAYDIAHYKGNYKEIRGDKRVKTIRNNGDRRELEEKAKEIYQEIMTSPRESFLKRTKSKIQNNRNRAFGKTISREKKKEGDSR